MRRPAVRTWFNPGKYADKNERRCKSIAVPGAVCGFRT